MGVGRQLDMRREIAAIIARMMVTCFTSMQQQYARGHLGSVSIDLLVGMQIRVNDADGRSSTILGVSRAIGVPRSSVRRSIDELVSAGVIKKAKVGYTGNPDYLAKRLYADCATDLPATICKAARDIKKALQE